MKTSIRVGTRGSALARWQADFVIERLKREAPGLEIELHIIKTTGDKDQTRSLADLGGLGAFTKEIENALLSHEIDLAVHSLKDLPTEMAEGLTLAAILEREDPRDCIVSRHGVGLMRLPSGARVGTSSARRAAEVLSARPDLQVVPLRGNVDTRLRKAQSDEYDAIVIAAAGVIRLGRASEITEYLPVETFLPDPGQGALAVQVRADDAELIQRVSRLSHTETRAAVTAERAFLQALGGGCRMPIGAYAQVREGQLHLRAMIASEDGSRVKGGEAAGEVANAEETGKNLARELAQSNAQVSPELPLRGKRVLVTRALEQADALVEKIRLLGGEAISLPTIEIVPLDDFTELDEALDRASESDWVIFTSANGVHAVAERLSTRKLTANFGSAKIAAIGPATAQALKETGWRVDFVPTKFLGEQIAVELDIARGQRALLLRADIASETLARILVERGVDVTNVHAYRTSKPDPNRRSALPKDIAAITFTSSSTVRNFVALANGDLTAALANADIFCIGPVTAETARELGLKVAAVASEHTIDGLVNTMRAYYEEKH